MRKTLFQLDREGREEQLGSLLSLEERTFTLLQQDYVRVTTKRGHEVEHTLVQHLKFCFRKTSFDQKFAYVCLRSFIMVLLPLQYHVVFQKLEESTLQELNEMDSYEFGVREFEFVIFTLFLYL
jgi:hypothetical protein